MSIFIVINNNIKQAIISFNNALEMRVKMYGEWHYYTAQVLFNRILM